jgi:hypothetical protein
VPPPGRSANPFDPTVSQLRHWNDHTY